MSVVWCQWLSKKQGKKSLKLASNIFLCIPKHKAPNRFDHVKLLRFLWSFFFFCKALLLLKKLLDILYLFMQQEERWDGTNSHDSTTYATKASIQHHARNQEGHWESQTEHEHVRIFQTVIVGFVSIFTGNEYLMMYFLDPLTSSI